MSAINKKAIGLSSDRFRSLLLDAVFEPTNFEMQCFFNESSGTHEVRFKSKNHKRMLAFAIHSDDNERRCSHEAFSGTSLADALEKADIVYDLVVEKAAIVQVFLMKRLFGGQRQGHAKQYVGNWQYDAQTGTLQKLDALDA